MPVAYARVHAAFSVPGERRAAGGGWSGLTASLFFDSLVRRFGQDLPAAAFFDLRALIDLPRVERLLVLQLLIALQASSRQGP